MRNSLAVMKRELRSYFYSPVAYAVIFIFLLIAGYFFYSAMVFYGIESYELSRAAQFMGAQELDMASSVLRPLFANLGVVMLLMTPIITMRLFSEEKKSGSIELLFTWPLRDMEMIFGKYLASVLILLASLAPTLLFSAFIAFYATPPWGVIATGYIGLFLMGSAFMALGLFVSTLTENQAVAAAITFGALLLLWALAWTVGLEMDTFSQTVKYLSILEHLDPFTKGVIDTRDIVYYLSFIFLFLFLSLRSLESKKWRG